MKQQVAPSQAKKANCATFGCTNKLRTGTGRICRQCYRNPIIRERFYPSPKPQRKYIRPCKRPTFFLPGSEGKIQVLQERLSRGESLWHPQDATFYCSGDQE